MPELPGARTGARRRGVGGHGRLGDRRHPLYEAATGQKPFAPLDAREQEHCDRDGYVQLVRPVVPLRWLRRGLPTPFVAAVEQCLQPNPSGRPTVARLTRELTSLLDQ